MTHRDHCPSMAFRNQVVSEARKWIGTPYRHQATLRGSGCDCLGLIRGIWREIVGPEPRYIPPYSMDWSEPSGEEVLFSVAKEILKSRPKKTFELGDVLLFRMRDGSVAKHLGIVSVDGRSPKFIHAYTGYGVVENSLSTPWIKRIAAVFSFPEEV